MPPALQEPHTFAVWLKVPVVQTLQLFVLAL
jgi:hypothetical protein